VDDDIISLKYLAITIRIRSTHVEQPDGLDSVERDPSASSPHGRLQNQELQERTQL
jgi:hypothetical protein